MANKVNACYLYSKANYPITIKYDGQDLILPPNASKFKLANEARLGVLPASVRKVTIREEK